MYIVLNDHNKHEPVHVKPHLFTLVLIRTGNYLIVAHRLSLGWQLSITPFVLQKLTIVFTLYSYSDLIHLLFLLSYIHFVCEFICLYIYCYNLNIIISICMCWPLKHVCVLYLMSLCFSTNYVGKDSLSFKNLCLIILFTPSNNKICSNNSFQWSSLMHL